jgi:hypothetical protein
MQKKVDMKFSTARSSYQFFDFGWQLTTTVFLIAWPNTKKNEKKFSVLEKAHLYNNILRKNNDRR